MVFVNCPQLLEIFLMYTRISDFSAVRRQLNYYGFRKTNLGTKEFVFQHPHFVRGVSEASLLKLKRKCALSPTALGKQLAKDLEAQAIQLSAELEEARVALEKTRAELEETRTELEEARAELEEARGQRLQCMSSASETVSVCFNDLKGAECELGCELDYSPRHSDNFMTSDFGSLTFASNLPW